MTSKSEQLEGLKYICEKTLFLLILFFIRLNYINKNSNEEQSKLRFQKKAFVVSLFKIIQHILIKC
jgi:hypothetical protein